MSWTIKKTLLLIGAMGYPQCNLKYIELGKKYNVKFILEKSQLRGIKDCDIYLDRYWENLGDLCKDTGNYKGMHREIKILVVGYGCVVIGNYKYISVGLRMSLCKLRNDYSIRNKSQLLSRYEILDFE